MKYSTRNPTGRTIVDRVCVRCERVFRQRLSGKTVRRFCSRKCVVVARVAALAALAKAIQERGAKICIHCRCDLPLKFFFIAKRNSDGLSASCKGCIYVHRYHGAYPVRQGRGAGLYVPGGAPAFRDPRSTIMREFVNTYWAQIVTDRLVRPRPDRIQGKRQPAAIVEAQPAWDWEFTART